MHRGRSRCERLPLHKTHASKIRGSHDILPHMGLISWCNRFIKSGFYLLFGIVPLLLTPWNYELFEYNKMMAVYVVTVWIGASWLVKMIAQKEVRLAKTPLDIPIVLFGLSQLISAIFSMDPHVSWFGYYSRFNGGMWSVISYVLLYYAFVSEFVSGDTYYVLGSKRQSKNKSALSVIPNTETVIRLLKTSLFTATIVAVYGVLEHMGIDKHIWVQDVQNRVFSTLGQPNWLAAYLIALTPLAMAFGLHHLAVDKVRHGFAASVYVIISVLFFIVLLYTRSRSGLLGLTVADVIFWAGYLWYHRDMWRQAAILHVLFALVVFFNGTYIPQIDKYVTFNGLKTMVTKTTKTTQAPPANTSSYTAPALETGGTESGTIRKYVWQAAISAWRSTTKTMLIGTGTESFAFAFYRFRPVAHNQTSEWDFLYNKAHNEYLNYLATTGLFGLGSYLLVLGAFIVWFVKNVHSSGFMVHRKTSDSLAAESPTMNYPAIPTALFAGWVSMLVTNFFGFSVVILQVFLFLFPAIAFVLYTRPNEIKSWKSDVSVPGWTGWIAVMIGIYTIFKIGSFWYADKLFAYGYQYDRAGLYAQAVPSLVTAISINPGEPLYHDELSGGYSALAVASFNSKNATQAATLAELALTESNKALAISPQNVNFLKTRTKVYYTLSTFDPSLNASAITTLEATLPLSPNDPKIYYNLAILEGRAGQNDKAISRLLQAKALKPDYRDVYNALNLFYADTGKKDLAKAILQEYLTKIDPTDKDFQTRLAK